MSYDLSLDRKSTIILGGGSALLVALVFLAGFLAGVTWRRDAEIAAMRHAPATLAVAAAPPSPPPAAKASTALPKSAKPAQADSVSAAPTPAVAAAPAITASKLAAEAPIASAVTPANASAIPSSPELSGVRLSIQVGSFLQKSNAEKLAGQLKQSGYNPEIVLAGIGDKQWNVVRVGPYLDWDQATQIAALLSRENSAPAVIHPIR
jgi:cell division protein FtsN